MIHCVFGQINILNRFVSKIHSALKRIYSERFHFYFLSSWRWEIVFSWNIETSLIVDVLNFLIQWYSFIAWEYMNKNTKAKFRDVEKLEKKLVNLKPNMLSSISALAS